MKSLPIVVTLLASGACKKKVDADDFEGFIKKRTDELGLSGAIVKCPSGVEAKPGVSFECTVGLGGKDYVLVATITSTDAKRANMDTKWKDGESVITSKLVPGIDAELGKQLGTPVAADCGKDAMRFLDANRNVTCDLAVETARSKVVITFDDKLVPTKWKLEPQLLAKVKLEQILTEPVRAKTSPGVAVTCGDQPLVQRAADGVAWCEISEGDKRAKLKVQVDDNLKVTAWEVVAAQ